MRANRRIALALAGALLGAPAARADTETAPPPKDPGASVDRGTRAVPGPAPEGRLKLGPFGDPYESRPLDSLASGPRFQAYVDVEDKAPRDPNETMQVWWRRFDLPEPAIYGRGINQRSPTAPIVDFVPLFKLIAKKIKERKGSQ